MADYYSHNDPRKKGNDQYLDYDTGGSGTWIWAVIIVVALIALIAIGSSGPVANTDSTQPVATEPAATTAPTITE